MSLNKKIWNDCQCKSVKRSSTIQCTLPKYETFLLPTHKQVMQTKLGKPSLKMSYYPWTFLRGDYAKQIASEYGIRFQLNGSEDDFYAYPGGLDHNASVMATRDSSAFHSPLASTVTITYVPFFRHSNGEQDVQSNGIGKFPGTATDTVNLCGLPTMNPGTAPDPVNLCGLPTMNPSTKILNINCGPTYPNSTFGIATLPIATTQNMTSSYAGGIGLPIINDSNQTRYLSGNNIGAGYFYFPPLSSTILSILADGKPGILIP